MVFARSCAWWVAVVAAVMLTGLPAVGQILPQELKSSQGELSDEQKQTIAQFVDPLMQGLLTADPAAVAQARTAILREFSTPDASARFKIALSNQITTHMDDALKSDQVLVRINAMIITTELTNPQARTLIDRGMNDSSAAVQYWGAKAFRDRVLRSVDANGVNQLPADEQRRIVNDAKEMITEDAAVPIVQFSFEILAALSIAEAQTTLLSILNDRVDQHAENPQASYRADQAAIAQLTNKIIRDRRDRGANAAVTKSLLATAYRYFELIVQQLAEADKVLPENRPGHKNMLDQAHQTLAAVSAREQNVQLPQGYNEVKEWINFNSWNKLADIAERWKPVLQSPPFDIPGEQLQISG